MLILKYINIFLVKSKMARFFRIIFVVYMSIWTISVSSFWIFFKSSHMEILYFVAVNFIILPTTTFTQSFFIGEKQIPIRYIWIVPIFFSTMYAFCILTTISLFELLSAGIAAFPNYHYFFISTFISIIGLSIGWIWQNYKHKI